MARAEFLAGEPLGDAERLAIGYAPAALRARYHGLLALDGLLARIALSAREPLPAQMRLAWWREACGCLTERAETPLGSALAESWRGETALLVGLVDAWEEVAAREAGLERPAEQVARARGAALAACAGESDAIALPAARCWSLVALAPHAADETERAAMLAAARATRLPALPRSLRPVAVLAGLARRSGKRGGGPLIGDRLSPLAAIRLGIFGR